LKYQTVLLRGDVEGETVTVAEEEVKFERLELPPIEEDREDSRERQLGLIEPERRPDRRDEVSPDLDEGDIDDLGDEAADEEEGGR
jgi:small subunit ribosomal protein S6